MTEQQMNSDPTYQHPSCTPCAACNESNTTTTRKRDVNETKTIADDTARRVPQLRFPEFQNAGEWESVKLVDIAEYENGVAHEQDIDIEGKYILVNSKFISSNGQVEKRTNTPHSLARQGDVLMVMSDLPNGRALAKCFYVPEDDKYAVNQRICKLHPHGLYGKFLYYLLDRNEYFLSFDDGVKQTNIKKDEVLQCPLMIPQTIEEQKCIADSLDAINALILSVNKTIEQLKFHKQALLQKLFPQRGKITPELRFPEFQNAGVWRTITLGDVVKVKSGYVFKSADYKKSGRYKILTIRNVQNGYLDISDCNSVDILPDDIQSHQILKEGDILISMTGNVGRVCKVNQNNFLLNQRVGVISIFNNEFDENFIYSLLIDSRFQQSMIESGQGAAQANISNTDIEKYTFAYPESKVEQKIIAACLQSIENEIIEAIAEIEVLQTQKKAFMQRLFIKQKK